VFRALQKVSMLTAGSLRYKVRQRIRHHRDSHRQSSPWLSTAANEDQYFTCTMLTSSVKRQYCRHLKDFKSGDVKDADKRRAGSLRAVKRAIDSLHEPLEHALVDRLADRLDRILHLRQPQPVALEGRLKCGDRRGATGFRTTL